MANTLSPKDKLVAAQQLINRAMELHQRGQPAAAETLYLQVLQDKPDHFEAQHLLGVLRGQQGRFDEALALVGAALKTRPDAVAALSNYALILHKLKRHGEALAAFDRALALRADNIEALNNRGNVLAELRRHDEALASYDRALALRPDYAEALNNRGNALSALERPQEALASYDRALAVRPNHAEALTSRGNVLEQLGRPDDALVSYVKALLIRPDHADAHYHRGNVLAGLGRFEDALRSYDKAVAARPSHAEAFDNRGNALTKLERPQEALASYEQALALRPDYAGAWHNRGNLLADLERHADALASYDRALAVQPDHGEALNGRGAVLHALGRDDAALESYDRALVLSPDNAAIHYNRASAAQALFRLEDALASYDRALAIKPDFPEAHYARGRCLHDMNHWREALDSFARALSLRPSYPEARFAMCMAELPILYESASEIGERRAAYESHLRSLSAEVDRMQIPADLATGVGSTQPFYLAYQGHNDRDLQRLYGTLVCRVMAARYPPAALAQPARPDEAVRVGIVSGYFCWHSVWKMSIRSWISQLDRRRFRVFGYYTGAQRDSATETAATLCERFVQGPLSIDRWREQIAGDALHVLIYPEIGMDPMAARLAAQRLAPVQCSSWGHPDTSGFPTIDHFLTSDLMEPHDGQDHYTERLIRLPNLSIYYEPLDLPAVVISRSEMGLRPGATIYWCGQSLFKYLPQFDQVFPRIARDAGDCQFAFIRYPKGASGTQLFQRRLERAFDGFGLTASDHCVFLPRLDPDRFIAAIGQCDVVLDSIGWSGFNTTMEGLDHDLPIVTMTESLMRGRHTTAVLGMMGVTETVAATIEDYVDTAVRLARDVGWRTGLRSKIAASKHRVHRDRGCAAVLEEFLDRVGRTR